MTEFQLNLARSYRNIGLGLRDTGKPADALKSLEAALAIQLKLADANPSISKFQEAVARSHNDIGTVLTSIGKTADAARVQSQGTDDSTEAG